MTMEGAGNFRVVRGLEEFDGRKFTWGRVTGGLVTKEVHSEISKARAEARFIAKLSSVQEVTSA